MSLLGIRSNYLRFLFGTLLFLFATFLIYEGYSNYKNLSLKTGNSPKGSFSIATPKDIEIQSLKLFIDHRVWHNKDIFYVYLDIEIHDKFDYLIIWLPWTVNPLPVKDESNGIKPYSIDSTGAIIVYGDPDKDIYLQHIMVTVNPTFEKRFYETLFCFPVYTGIVEGMPYSKSKKTLYGFEPKINFFEIIFMSSTYRSFSTSYPAPDAIVESSPTSEIRWWFNPDKNKFPSSIYVTFVDKDLQNEENRIAFNSGIYLSIGFSIILSLLFTVFMGKAEKRQLVRDNLKTLYHHVPIYKQKKYQGRPIIR